MRLCFLSLVMPRNTSVGPRSKRAVTANPHLMTRPNLAAKGMIPVGPAQGMLNGRSASTNVVNRYLSCCLFLFIILPDRSYSLRIIILFRADDSSPPVARPRSTSSRSVEDVSSDSHVTNGSNRLSADLDNYAQVRF